MRINNFDIIENTRIAHDTFSMALFGDCGALSLPGQFVGVELPGFFLRRPFSICACSGSILTIVYKIVGDGTRTMSDLRPGHALRLLTGLGNGFNVEKCGNKPLLVGGGVGTAPLYWLSQALLENGKRPTAILGFNSANEIFMAAELKILGVQVFITTADGSAGMTGFVTDAIAKLDPDFDYIYACGPEPMLQALYGMTDIDGQYSFEARMGCGFGACYGCTCKTRYGAKRICKDGPVLERGEIIW